MLHISWIDGRWMDGWMMDKQMELKDTEKEGCLPSTGTGYRSHVTYYHHYLSL